jgi:hypothetical protein
MSFEELELFRSMGFLDEQILKAAEQVKLEQEYLEYCRIGATSHEGI